MRTGSWLVIVALVSAFVVGCGSTSSQGVSAGASPTPAGSGTTPVGSGGGAPHLAVAVCSLLSASQVTALLGAPAAQPGKETVYDANYKTCSWATGSAAGNANSLRLGVVLKANASSSGFAAPTSAGTPSPISGVGDSATFASAGGGAGAFGESILVANKALASRST